MRALKGQWVVTAGVILGRPEEDHTRVFTLTSEDLEGLTDREQAIKFAARRDTASIYASLLQDPGHFNWVQLSWIWL